MIEIIEDGTKHKYAMRCKWCNTKFSFTYDDIHYSTTVSMVRCPVCRKDVFADYSEEVSDESDKNDR
jgi:uncharacterized protein with PIN domain